MKRKSKNAASIFSPTQRRHSTRFRNFDLSPRHKWSTMSVNRAETRGPTTLIIRRCSTKYLRAKANSYDLSLRTMDSPLQIRMNGTYFGPPARAKASYMRALTSFRESITSHKARKLQGRTDYAPILSICRNVSAEKHSTSSPTPTSYRQSFMTFTFTFKS